MDQNTKKKKYRGLLSSFQRGPQGQTSLIMILILAAAFIFYAISLNWSKISSVKTTLWMASVTASAQSASMFASYGERVIQEQLIPLGGIEYNNGNLRHEENGLGVLIFKIFIIIVVAILTWYMGGYPAAILVAAMMTTSLVIEYMVIRPMTFSMWNKLQQNLQPVDQFRESAITTGMQQIVTDSVTVPDRFDLNVNGLWGASTNPSDPISRFALFYTERLKAVKPPDTAGIEAFQTGLNNLITQPTPANIMGPTLEEPGLGFTPYCTGKNSSDPQCNPQCTGIFNRPALGNKSSGFGWRYTKDTDQITYYVPGQCIQANGTKYRLQYNSAKEGGPKKADPNDPTNSFRYRLGFDDEIGKSLNSDKTNGSIDGSPVYHPATSLKNGLVFPMLNQMYKIDPSIYEPVALGALSADLSKEAQAQYSKLYTDSVTPMANYLAGDVDCAQMRNSSEGFYWKKGADRYCSGFVQSYPLEVASLANKNVSYAPSTASQEPNYHWPYYQCQYMLNSQGEIQQCADSPNKKLWPQDRMDNLVYQINEFIQFNNTIKGMDKKSLVASFDQWYQTVMPFIAPRCSEGNSNTPLDQFVSVNFKHMTVFTSDAAICNPDAQGYMYQWIYDLQNWQKLIKDPADPKKGWINQSFGDPAKDLCSGKLSNSDPMNPGIAECLENKSIYTKQLDKCDNNFPKPTEQDEHGQWIYSNVYLNPECIEVMYHRQTQPSRFLTTLSGTFTNIPSFPPPSDFKFPVNNKETYFAIKGWVKDNRILMDAVYNKKIVVQNLYKYAQQSASLFEEGAQEFSRFLGLGAPAYALMDSVSDRISSIKRLPSFAIYGWKDHKGPIGSNTNNELWHLARIEVAQPGRLPWIKITKHGALGSNVRYTYTDGQGDVLVRATRWDQSFDGGIANFANGLKIWKFRYGNPKYKDTDTNTGGELENMCMEKDTGAGGVIFGYGLTSDTRAALQANLPHNPSVQSNSSEGKAYSTAFMLNLDPRASTDKLTSQIKDPVPDKNTCHFADKCGTLNDYAACCAKAPSGYYGKDWQQYCQKTNLARCQKNKQIKEIIDNLKDTEGCFYGATDLLNTGVQSISGAHFGVPNEKPYHLGIFFHSSADAKKQGVFTRDTYNDHSQYD